TGVPGAAAAQGWSGVRSAGILACAFAAHFVVGGCRQNMPAVDLRLPPAKTSGDAFDVDQVQIDRDHSRNGFVPSDIADGYRIDSNGNSAEPLSHAQNSAATARERSVSHFIDAL